jgi:glycosyltransferase involved in cell wall biosynthesis
MSEPLLSALVSTYGSERYLRGCLDSLLAQTIADQIEIVVVDACSPEGEGEIVRDYQRRFPRLQYLRTETRECSSRALNRATRMARGRYLTTANADDRHRPDFAERLVDVLEQRPEFGIAYADSLISRRDNETYANTTAVRRYAWPDYTPAAALSCCLFGAQPVWRRRVHDTVGLWDPEYRYANDQDMFLRIALRFGAVHVKEPLGLFLMRPDSNSGANNHAATLRDVLAVMRKYRTTTPLETIFPALALHAGDPTARAAAWFELGNLCALGPYTDASLALDCYRQAVATPLPPASTLDVRTAFANNTACILACAGAHTEAGRAFALVAGDPTAARNQERVKQNRVNGRQSSLRELAFHEVEHPAIERSRSSRGLALLANGSGQWTEPVAQRPWDVFDGPNGVPWTRASHDWVLPARQPAAACPAPPVASTEHVLIVMYGWADSGGGTMLPRSFAHFLAKQGTRVTVFYAAAKPEPTLPAYGLRRHEDDGVALLGLCNRPAQFMDLTGPEREVDDPTIREAFGAVLDELRPDVVHFWNLHNLGMSLPRECKQRGLPTVLSSNNYWAICPRLYLISERLQRCTGASQDGTRCERCLGTEGSASAHAARRDAGVRMLRCDIDVHLAVSTRVRDLYVQNGDDPCHVRVLRQEPPGVTELWQKVGTARRITETLQRPLRVGFLGSVMAHKGVHVLVQALQLLPANTVECVALGDLTPDYHAWLQRLDARGAVHFFGRYDPQLLPDLLARFDVMVVPSIWDDCAPFVVAEALAARCPVIGSQLGGIPDFVQDGENGFLFPTGDARALADCLLAFHRDPTLLGRMQRRIAPPRGLAAFVADVREVYSEVTAAVRELAPS